MMLDLDDEEWVRSAGAPLEFSKPSIICCCGS